MENEYNVKNVKTFEGMEGPGYNATLYKDDKKIATLIDEGCGGCVIVRWIDKNESAPFYEFLKTLPKFKVDDREFDIDDTSYLYELVENYIWERKLRRLCKTRTLVRLKGDDKDSYRTLKVKFSKEYAAKLRAQDTKRKLAEIINERFEPQSNVLSIPAT